MTTRDVRMMMECVRRGNGRGARTGAAGPFYV